MARVAYVKHADGEAYAAEQMDMLAAEHERTPGFTPTVRTMRPATGSTSNAARARTRIGISCRRCDVLLPR